MQRSTQRILIALVIVLLIITFYLIYKDILNKTGLNVQSTMQIVYDPSKQKITYNFLNPELNQKYAGDTMLLTSFAPDNDTVSMYSSDTLTTFISALKTAPVTVAITPINTLSNSVDSYVPKAFVNNYKGGALTIGGTGVVRITPK